MVAYSFKKSFAPLIDANQKLQTIRAERRRHARPGEELQLYQGMRTKHCRLIGRRLCKAATPVRLIFLKGIAHRFFIDDSELSPSERAALALADGFGHETGLGLEEMADFWMDEHGQFDVIDFNGVLIEWHPGG